MRRCSDFLTALADGTLPPVSFVKPDADDGEHPGFASIVHGQEHLNRLVRAVRASRYWANVAILITYDDNGGSWDHVAPPVADRWGPGVRVPLVIVSPWAKHGFVDHTSYGTTAILRFIEALWRLAPLGSRDAAAADLSNAFDTSAVAESSPFAGPVETGVLALFGSVVMLLALGLALNGRRSRWHRPRS